VRTLIVSDLHANLYALDAVITDARDSFDRIVCCGDLVGYNPHPGEIIDWARTHCAVIVRGNHDKVVAGIDAVEWFNETARTAALWTRERLSSAHLEYLRSLPKGPIALDDFEIWHGSRVNEDEYVTNVNEARPLLQPSGPVLAFFGHTHLQGGFFSKYGRVATIPPVRRRSHEWLIPLEQDVIYMINPGAVGQPRDGDPRAAYAIFDAEKRTVTLRRVEYPVEKTALDIRNAGLPDVLAARLFHGM
jgi:diadenosine tetraphosphatase ApaH/serine/threonine PP2A family protein phosphatase